MGWEADPDWPRHTAACDSPDDLWAMWDSAVADSRAIVAGALTDGGLGTLGVLTHRTEAGLVPSRYPCGAVRR